MAFGVAITLDKKDLERLHAIGKKAPIAIARALTATAKDAQATLKGGAAGEFHLRNSWVQQGIRITPATSGTMTAQVGSIDKYMRRHVVGEDKRPASSLKVSGKRSANGRLATGGLLVPAYGSIGEVPKHQKTRSKLKRIGSQRKKSF